MTAPSSVPMIWVESRDIDQLFAVSFGHFGSLGSIAETGPCFLKVSRDTWSGLGGLDQWVTSATKFWQAFVKDHLVSSMRHLTYRHASVLHHSPKSARSSLPMVALPNMDSSARRDINQPIQSGDPHFVDHIDTYTYTHTFSQTYIFVLRSYIELGWQSSPRRVYPYH